MYPSSVTFLLGICLSQSSLLPIYFSALGEKVIYPDKYSDIDMLSATKEFYSNFYHFDLSDEQAKQILLDSGLKEENF